MKKLTTLFLLLCLFCMQTAVAIPAHKGTVKVTQPDGTTVTIRLLGDEYLHFNTTDDGYSIVKNNRGFYVYAQMGADGQLKPTTMVAHDVALRQTDETAWLAKVQKYLTPRMTTERAQEKEAEMKRQAQARARHKAGQYNYSNFRGLVILIEYSDKQFSRADYKDIMNDMINQENYTGYTATNGRKQNFVGSVRDYYSDQSQGLFQPEFDVYGPYSVNYKSTQGGQRSSQILNAALTAADPDINFADYDRDGDGQVDMVYFILAGNGANFGDNDQNLWWPHRSVIYNGWNYVYKDGVRLWDYASSVELYGYTSAPSTVTIDGIGTICHEFSHVLGLPDFYDADYAQSSGQSHDPGEWSVMAGGSYNNYSRQPVGYSLFERYAVGFTTPQTLDVEGEYTLPNLMANGTGFRLNTPVNKEFFILENRQQDNKWERYLPGHGMLVFRVDSTNAQVWQNNQVNNNPNHNYYELIRAGGYQGSGSGADPFPGTRRVRTLNNTTSPANLLTWAGQETPFGLDNIQEQGGAVTFTLVNVNVLKEITLPATASVGLGLGLKLVPERYPESAPYTLAWSSSNPNVATVNDEGIVTGVSLGEADITVTANDNPALSATCHVTVHETVNFTSIADYKTLAEGDKATLSLTDAQVVIVNGNDVYLRDTSGAIILRGFSGLSKGNVLNGSFYGRYSVEDKMPYVTVVSGTTTSNVTVSSGSEAQPREIDLEELSEKDYADFIKLQKVTLQRVTSGALTGIFAVSENHRVRIFNTFGLSGFSMPTNYQGKTYNVPGILVTRLSGGEIFDELALMGAPEEIVKQTFTLNYRISAGGAVLMGERTLTGNGSLTLNEGDNAELLAVPAEGYVIEQIKLDGENVAGEKVSIYGASANHVVEVKFALSDTPENPDDADTDISVLDNLIYVAKAEGFSGSSLNLSLQMKNSAPIRGFQFDLYLPDGVTVAKRSNGRIIASLNSNRLPDEDEHTLNVVEQSNGSIRFLCSSLYDETFTGNSGELISLTVNIAEGMADGDYPVIIRDMKLTETNINNFYEQDYVKSTLTINSYIVGDINSDGNVDVSDYTGIANYILGQTPEGFVEKAGDVNGDGQIDVSDYTGVANIILTGSLYSPATTQEVRATNIDIMQKVKAANTDISVLDNVIYVDSFNALAGEEMDLSIKMKNSAPIRGFQFDLYLPDGVEVVTSSKGKVSCALSAGRLPEDDEHNLNAAVQADGAVRFLCSSMYDETFTGNDGELMTVRIKIASDMADGTYPLKLMKMKLTESDIRNFYENELVESSITIANSDGIQTVKTNVETKAVFNLAGQKVNGDYKGIVIKDGRKVMVK